jgi:hypothetical protein
VPDRRPTLRTAQRALGDALIVRIDPRTVDLQVTGKLPLVRRARARIEALPAPLPATLVDVALRAVARTHPFVLTAADYPAAWPLDGTAKVARLVDLVAHLDDPRSSRWWTDHCELLGAGETLRLGGTLVTDRDGLGRHLDGYLLPLITSMSRDGYREDLGAEHGIVHVGADGSLHKANKGNHRFALARILGLTDVPVRIQCVHETWWGSVTGSGAGRGGTTARGGRSLRARLGLVRDALRGVEDAHTR